MHAHRYQFTRPLPALSILLVVVVVVVVIVIVVIVVTASPSPLPPRTAMMKTGGCQTRLKQSQLCLCVLLRIAPRYRHGSLINVARTS